MPVVVFCICNVLLQYLHALLQLCQRPRERRLAAASLPLEILAQVFTHLDFPSVRAVRLTSKTFYSVTKTRQFWYYHINRLIEVHHVSVPEEQLDAYAVDELERWTLRRSRALDVFFNSEQPRFRKRMFNLRPEGLSELRSYNFRLIPGGRWLLVSHPSAVLYFMDLDSPNSHPRRLFDPKEITNEILEPRHVYFTIWIDRGAPHLSFRLAFIVRAKDVLRTYTSQIDLAGHGVDATLVVSDIAMLRSFNLDMWPVGFTLNDHYLVHVWSDNVVNARIGVYDYRQALGCPDYRMNHGGDHSTDVVFPGMTEFICDDILAVQCMASRSLFIFAIESTTSLNLLHRIHMHSFPWSTPRWTPEATLVTMIEDDTREVQGLVIPHDSSLAPRIVTLGRCNNRKTCNYTLGSRVLVAHDNPHKVFSHDWDFNSPDGRPPTLTCQFQERLTTNLLTFDEDNGRFIGYPSQWDLVIYDIV